MAVITVIGTVLCGVEEMFSDFREESRSKRRDFCSGAVLPAGRTWAGGGLWSLVLGQVV